MHLLQIDFARGTESVTLFALVLAMGCSLGPAGAGDGTPIFEVVRSGPPVDDRGISRGAAWGDYTGDGLPDLLVTRPTWDGRVQHNVLYRNLGDGHFASVEGPFGPPGAWEGAVWVDVDGDGDLDLHVVGRDRSGSLLFENLSGRLIARESGPFDGIIHSSSMSCWADADGDGRLDVFIVGSGEGRNALFRNEGEWRFSIVQLPPHPEDTGAGRACAWGDLDGDGLPEIAVANARRPNLLLRNRGNMVLISDTSTALQQDTTYGYGLSWSDTNADGIRDLFVANFDAPNRLYLGRADGGLELVPLDDELQSAATKGHVWGDFDMDGRLDVYLGSGTPRPGMLNRLYLGQGDGRFTLVDEGEFATHADTSAAIASADYDGDGDLDVFVANWGSPGATNRLYRSTVRGRSWLKVYLEGTRSNRMGIGARVSALVTLDDERLWMHRWLDAATGYAGQNEPVIHFGLGHADQVDSLVVAWPSGVIDRFAMVSARRSLRVIEGAER